MRVEARIAAQRDLMRRFGDDLEQRWADDPDAPRWSGSKTLDRVFQAVWDHANAAASAGLAPGKEDAIAALRFAADARREVDLNEYSLIKFARGQGATWPELADAFELGSPQAAAQRFQRIAARLGLPTNEVPVREGVLDSLTCSTMRRP